MFKLSLMERQWKVATFCIALFASVAVLRLLTSEIHNDALLSYRQDSGDENIRILSEKDVLAVSEENAAYYSGLLDTATKRKTLFLHIGIHKTGTTFLQCTFSTEFAMDMLIKDGIAYLGTSPRPCGEYNKNLVPHMLQPMIPVQFHDNSELHRWGATLHDPVVASNIQTQNSLKDQRLGTGISDPLKRKLDEVMSMPNVNKAFLIYEDLSTIKTEGIFHLSKYLAESNWNVQIILGYRRYYEWLPSKYNQVTKPKSHKIDQWPADNHKVYLFQEHKPFSLSSEHANFTKFTTYLDKVQLHPSDIAAKNFRQFFKNVHPINLHELPPTKNQGNDSYLEHLLCDVLEASNFCFSYRSGSNQWAETVYSNPSVPLGIDRIALSLYKDGEVPANLSRTDVRRKISKIIKSEDNPLLGSPPLSCTERDDLHRLYQASEKMERHMWGAVGDSHKAGFDKMVAQQKFCQIDSASILENATWTTALKEAIHDIDAIHPSGKDE